MLHLVCSGDLKIAGADPQIAGDEMAAQVPSPAFLSAICAII